MRLRYTLIIIVIIINLLCVLSSTPKDINVLAEEFLHLFNQPILNVSELTYPYFDITIKDVQPLFTYTMLIFREGIKRIITYKECTVNFIFTIDIKDKDGLIYFTKKNQMISLNYPALHLIEASDLTFDIFGATEPTSFDFQMKDLEHFEVFSSLFENSDTNEIIKLFKKEWSHRITSVINEYPQSKAVTKFHTLISTIQMSPNYPITCCTRRGIHAASIKDIHYESISKIGDYRQFNNVSLSVSYRVDKIVSLYSILIDYIIVANNTISFGIFRTKLSIVVDIVKEVFETVFDSIINNVY